MDVTKNNFDDSLAMLRECLTGADFVAIDLEFSGLSTGVRGAEVHMMDDSQTRYAKMAESCSLFIPLQYGVCVFRREQTPGGPPDQFHYAAYPFNFNICSCPCGNHFDRRFLMQSSSVKFLADNHFDFNKVFRDGVSFLSRHQEIELRAKGYGAPPGSLTGTLGAPGSASAMPLTGGRNREHTPMRSAGPDVGSAPSTPQTERKDVTLSDQDREWMDKEIVPKIIAWKAGDTGVPLVLPPCNSYHRLLIFQEVRTSFLDLRAESQTSTGSYKSVILTFVGGSADAQAQADASFNERQEKKLRDMIGFRLVMDAVSDAHVPVVGHNCALDLLLSSHNFVRPLPATLAEWKAHLRELFPAGVCDTRRIASLAPFENRLRGLTLERMSKELTQLSQSVQICVGGTASTSAGDDAFARYRGVSRKFGVSGQPTTVATDDADAETPAADDETVAGAELLHEAGFDALLTGACLVRLMAVRSACTLDNVDDLLGEKRAPFSYGGDSGRRSGSSSVIATPFSVAAAVNSAVLSGEKRKRDDTADDAATSPAAAGTRSSGTPAVAKKLKLDDGSTPPPERPKSPATLAREGIANAERALQRAKEQAEQQAELQTRRVHLVPVNERTLQRGTGGATPSCWPGARLNSAAAGGTLLGVTALHKSSIPFHVAGKPAEPDMSAVFCVTNIPEEWRTSDVMPLFEQFPTGRATWLDPSTCFVPIQLAVAAMAVEGDGGEDHASAVLDRARRHFAAKHAPKHQPAVDGDGEPAPPPVDRTTLTAADVVIQPFADWQKGRPAVDPRIAFDFVPRNSDGMR